MYSSETGGKSAKRGSMSWLRGSENFSLQSAFPVSPFLQVTLVVRHSTISISRQTVMSLPGF
jgi:hypothetical protein